MNFITMLLYYTYVRPTSLVFLIPTLGQILVSIYLVGLDISSGRAPNPIWLGFMIHACAAICIRDAAHMKEREHHEELLMVAKSQRRLIQEQGEQLGFLLAIHKSRDGDHENNKGSDENDDSGSTY